MIEKVRWLWKEVVTPALALLLAAAVAWSWPRVKALDNLPQTTMQTIQNTQDIAVIGTQISDLKTDIDNRFDALTRRDNGSRNQ